ncbi:MAG: hypothetical protein O2944_00185 [Proteobacteria bacterium]|nr:hypothetical protein [Pseudomonadota bacterium]
MNEPIWLRKDAAVLLHAASITEHGGSPGLRHDGMLDSALTRPVNKFASAPEMPIHALAAAYAFGLARWIAANSMAAKA